MNNKSNYIKLGIFSALIIGVIVFVMLPTLEKVFDKKETLRSETIALEQQRKQKNDNIDLTRQYEDIQESSELLKKAFVAPATSSILQTIEEIEMLATKRKVTQELNITPLPDGNSPELTSSAVLISLDGAYENIYGFILDLESLPYYVPISELSLTQIDTTTYSASLHGEIFWK